MPIRGPIKGRQSINGLESDPTWLGYDYGDGNYVGTGLEYMSSDNPMYDAYYKANPYVNQTYHKTWIDSVFGGVFRTGYDKWLNEMQLASAQYNQGVVDLEQQNLYNSESAKAQRMRAAGENPDLLGTGDVSDAARPMEDPQDVQLPESVDLSSVASFAGMIGQCFEGALGMASAGIDLIGKLSSVDSQQISNAKGYQDLALEYIRNSIPSEGLESDADYNSWKEKLAVLSQPDVAWSESLARSLGLKKHQRKSFDFALNNAIGNLPSEYERFKMMDDYADKKLSTARKVSSSFYDQSFEVMSKLSRDLVDANDQLQSILARNKVKEQEVQELALENDIASEELENQYLEKANQLGIGRSKAITENEQFNLTKIQQSIDKVLKQTRQKILHMLEGMIEEGNSFANYMLYNMMLHEYMNFEFKAKGELGLGRQLPKTIKGLLPSIGGEMEFGASM